MTSRLACVEEGAVQARRRAMFERVRRLDGRFVVAAAPIPAMVRHAIFCGMWATWLIPTGVVLSQIGIEIRAASALFGVQTDRARSPGLSDGRRLGFD